MTLRSAARPRRALTGHSAGIFVSLHTLTFYLWFTLSTLPVHLVISYSHTFLLSVTWPARCPVTDSQRTGQGLEASFHKTLNSLLDFKSAPQMLYLCKSHTFHFNAIPYPLWSLLSYLWVILRVNSFMCELWLNEVGPLTSPCQSSSYCFTCCVWCNKFIYCVHFCTVILFHMQ